jgi:hypothetical protein
MIKHCFTTCLYFAFFLLLSWCCNDHEFPKQTYPGLETKPVTDVSESGAVLHGKIRRMGTEHIRDHGFIWSLQPNPQAHDSEKISLGALPEGRGFQAHIQYGLIPDTTYYVKAFTATDDHMVYGGIVNFRSAGSLPPVIENFTPRQGSWGDTLKIEGKYYSSRMENVKVMFGSLEAETIMSSDSTIECIVPSNIAEPSIPFKVIVAGQEATSPANFRLLAPVIESFSPESGTFRDIVTITGSNFSRVKLQNKVRFNEFFAEVVASSPTTLSVVVPPGLLYKENKITVTVNLQSAESAELFIMNGPEITSVSPTTGVRGTTVRIEGINFAPISGGNTVKFGGNKARVVSVSETYLQVVVPDGVYDSREAEISVTVAEQKDIAAESFSLKDPWLEKNNIPGEKIDYATAFAIGDKGYLGLGSPGSQSFWQFSPQENVWTAIAPFPGEGRHRATSFVIDGHAYVGGGVRRTLLSDFWRYDPASDSWTQVADFPFGVGDAVGLSVNGKGYVVAKHPREAFNDLWEYDPATDAWTMIRDEGTTLEFIADAGFVADNRLFFYPRFPGSSVNLHDLLEFDLETSFWMLWGEDNNQDYDPYATGFSLNGKGYIIVEGRVKEYDPEHNVWATVLGVHPPARQAANAFVIGDKVYFGFGHRGSTRVNDFWEWDMNYRP